MDRPAPHDLELLRRFVNAWDLESGTDELLTTRAAQDTLRGLGLAAAAGRSRHDLDRLVTLREALRHLMLENNGYVLGADSAIEHVNGEYERLGLQLRLGERGTVVTEWSLEQSPADAVAATLLGLHLAAVLDGTWRRLKACPSEACHWAFYDSSRNVSSRWCSMSICGNRSKARTFRQNQQTASSDS